MKLPDCHRYTLISLILMMSIVSYSQNLVPNPSFEIYTECPFGLNDGEPLECIPWDQGNEGSTDYFNRCAFPLDAGVPDNAAGHQEPISGDACIGLISRRENDYREYAMSPLIAPLSADSTYLATFYISTAEILCYTNAFGALFTIGPPVADGGNVLDYLPQVEVYGDFLNDYQNWITISRCFVADGGEDYITLGNFRDTEEALYDPACPLGGDFIYHAYYYLDSVSVIKLPASFDDFTLSPVTACGSYEIDPGSAENYTWSDGTTNPTLTVTESGTYFVTLSNECAFSYGEIDVTILPDAPPVALPNDTMLCTGESIEVILDPNVGDYAWQDGSTESDYTIISQGEYIVELTDNCDVTSDTIIVEFLDVPELFTLGVDTLICDGDAFTISFDPALGDFMWQDGSNASSYTIDEDGIYALTISNLCGQSEDAIEVGFVEQIDFSIGPDQTILCDGDQILIELDPDLGDFEWYDMSTESSYLISSGGVVSVTITNACFSSSDEMEVMVVEAPVFSLGTDITVCPGQLPLTFDLSGVPYAENYLWDDGFTGSMQQITTGGTHGVTISNSCFSVSDAVQITILDDGPEVTLPEDQLLCQGQNYVLSTDIMGTYQWLDVSTGVTSDADTFLVTAPGIYALTVTNICGSDADSIVINYIAALASPDLGADFSLCPGEAGVLYANVDGVDYQWNDLSTADSLIIAGPGTYSLQISDACSSASDTVVVTANANPPDLDLPASVDLCQGDTVVIDAGVTGVQYLWNDASTGSATTAPELIVTTSGIYYLQVSNACGTDADTIVINDAGPVPTVSLGADLSLCPGDVINVIPISSDVQSWLWHASTGSASTDTIFTVDSAGTIIVYASNSCGQASDTIDVTLLPPTPTLDLGADLSICPGESVTLTINEPNVDILWHDGTTDAEYIATNAGFVHATISNACGSISDSVLVSLLVAAPSLDLGADQSLCPGESITFDPGINDVTYQWHDGSTSQVFQTTLPGNIILTISNDCGSATDTVVIIEDTNGPQLDLGPDILACEGDVVILEAAISGVNYLWQDASTGSATTEPELIVTTSGIYYLEVSNACGNDIDTIVVDIHGTIPVPSLGADTSLCEGEVLQLISNADVETSIEWHASTGSADTSSTLLVTKEGIYILSETNHCGSASDSIVITYNEQPIVFDLGEDVVLCPGDSILLIAPATTDVVTWQDGSNGAIFIADQELVYSLQISNDCGLSSDDVFVSFDQDVPVVDLEPSLSICPDQSVMLDVTQIFDASYLWNTGSTLPSIVITQPALYAVTVSTECYTETDNILIEADDDCEHEIFIPNVFSPNGDNVNDEWIVHVNDPDITGILCRVFDRWGDLVFETTSSPVIWNGRFGDREVLPGVYVYVVELEYSAKHVRVFSGSLTVIR